MTCRSAAILAALALLVFASTAYAAAPAKPTPPKTVSLELTDTTVVEALESLFKGTNLSYITQPGVGGVISSLRLKDVSFSTALNAIVKAAGLEANIEDGVYIIGKPEPAPVVAATPAPVVGGDSGSATANPSDTQNPNPGQSIADNTQPAPSPYPDYQYGPQPGPSPVYYGNYPPAYYNYGPAPAYGYGYGYNPSFSYGYPQVYVPGYQRGSVMLPLAGSIFSSGIGPARITPAPNHLAPLGQ